MLQVLRPSVLCNRSTELTNWANVLDRFFESDNRLDYRASSPKTNVLEFDDHYRLDMYIPGVAKEDLKIELENNRLTVSKPVQQDQGNEKFNLQEFENNGFERSFTLSNDIDSANLKADHKNGILSITLPKKEEAKPVKREISIA
jgi:HSP20 family protein